MNRKSATHRALATLLSILSLSILASSFADDAVTATLWEGVYTEAQALRGKQVYEPNCQSCHAADMRGGPAVRGLVGVAFQFLWKGKPLSELYSSMRTKMPPGNPGTLSEQEYIDVLALILQQNGFPSGDGELKPELDALQEIPISWEKPAGSPAPDPAK